MSCLSLCDLSWAESGSVGADIILPETEQGGMREGTTTNQSFSSVSHECWMKEPTLTRAGVLWAGSSSPRCQWESLLPRDEPSLVLPMSQPVLRAFLGDCTACGGTWGLLVLVGHRDIFTCENHAVAPLSWCGGKAQLLQSKRLQLDLGSATY